MASITYPPIPIFELGPLNLSLHGLFAGLGFVAGAALMLREVRRRGFDTEGTTSVLTWALVAAMLGARFFTVPAHLGDPGYGADDIFALAGDFSILGGYAGGILGGLVRFRMLKIPALPISTPRQPASPLVRSSVASVTSPLSSTWGRPRTSFSDTFSNRDTNRHRSTRFSRTYAMPARSAVPITRPASTT